MDWGKNRILASDKTLIWLKDDRVSGNFIQEPKKNAIFVKESKMSNVCQKVLLVPSGGGGGVTACKCSFFS